MSGAGFMGPAPNGERNRRSGSRNDSLTCAGARLFFATTCLFSLSFALLFVIQGFWPILLFWALDRALG
jgi:uncharacterized membrane protein